MAAFSLTPLEAPLWTHSREETSQRVAICLCQILPLLPTRPDKNGKREGKTIFQTYICLLQILLPLIFDTIRCTIKMVREKVRNNIEIHLIICQIFDLTQQKWEERGWEIIFAINICLCPILPVPPTPSDKR